MIAASAALALALALCGGAAAELNVDCEIGWQGCWRPTEWLPVEVRIQSPFKTPFEGSVSISGRQDELTNCTIQHRIVVTPDVPLTVPLVTKIEFGAPTLRLEIRDADGRLRYHADRALFDFSTGTQHIEAIPEADFLIVTSGRNAFGLLDLGKGATSRFLPWQDDLGAANDTVRVSPADRVSGDVHVKEKSERGLPWDWTAYAAVDLLVLYDASWTALRPEQCHAIADHVSRGGGLLIVLGGNVLPPDHTLAKLLPFAVGEARQLEFPVAFTREWGLTAVATPSLPVWSIDAARETAVKVMTFTPVGANAEVVYYATAPVGLGRVGVLAFDPARFEGVKWSDNARFWVEVMQPLRYSPVITAEGRSRPSDESRHSYELGVRARGDQALMTFQYDIPELRPISVAWIILLLVGLAIVIGPVDYLLLKRFDRLPLTWITLPAYLIVFSVLAFWGIQALRAGKAQARAVTVLDMVQGRSEAWSSTYTGIYAPASDDWRPVDDRRPQWWSSFSPRESDSLYRYRAASGTTRRLVCLQEDGRSIPTYMPINVWSIQSVLTEERVAAAPPVAVENIRLEDGVLSATVTSLLDRTIDRVDIRVREDGHAKGVSVGTLAPRERRDVSGSISSARISAPIAGIAADSVFVASGNIDQTYAFERLLDEGWAIVYLRIEDPPLPFILEQKEYATRHVQLVRVAVRRT